MMSQDQARKQMIDRHADRMHVQQQYLNLISEQ